MPEFSGVEVKTFRLNTLTTNPAIVYDKSMGTQARISGKMNGFNDKLGDILQGVRGRRILIIGDAMLDNYIWGDATRISPEAPVPVVKVARETHTAGGAANVALNVASLGGEATLFSRLGDDTAGNKLASILADAGVRLLDGCVSSETKTIVKTRIICRRQQLCRLDTEAPSAEYALGEADVAHLIAPTLSGFDALIVSDYAKGLVSSESIRAILRATPDGMFTALDPKPRPGMDYSGFSVMTPNRAEALEMAGLSADSDPFPTDDVFARLHERFAPHNLVVTMGAEGMLIGGGGVCAEHIPTVAREVFDVSGAGDTVIAALTLAASAGASIGDAARFANVAAGYVVGKIGTATATPQNIRELLNS